MEALPDEILAFIFVLCLSQDDWTPRRSIAPLLVCHICSRWRGVATSTGALWSSLTLALITPKKSVVLEVLSTYLARSQGSQFSITLNRGRLDGHVAYSVPEKNLLVGVMRLLADHAPRIQHLDMKRVSISGRDMDAFAIMPPSSLTNVSHLSLDMPNFGWLRCSQLDASTLAGFSSAPIKDLDISFYAWMNVDIADLPLPWRGIAHLTIKVNPRSVHSLVNSVLAEPLETLYIHVQYMSESGLVAPHVAEQAYTNLPKVYLPRLWKLGVESINDGSPAEAICRIECPALKELMLTWHSPLLATPGELADFCPQEYLTQLCSRPLLQCLTLYQIPLPTDAFIKCARGTPYISTLHISGWAEGPVMLNSWSWNDFVRRLTWSSDPDHQVLPLLTTFHASTSGSILDTDILVGMIESRSLSQDNQDCVGHAAHAAKPAPLQDVYCDIREHVNRLDQPRKTALSDDSRARYERLIKGGLSIRFQGRS